jgi:hypothetical protein
MADKHLITPSPIRRAGQIIERGKDTYCLRVFIGYDKNARRIYANETFRGTKRKAQARLAEMVSETSRGVFVRPERMTLNAYLDEWLKTAVLPRVRERTYFDYREYLVRYVRPEIGRRPLGSLRPLDIRKIYTRMQERGLAAKTIRYCHAILRNALQQAERWEMIPRNSC